MKVCPLAAANPEQKNSGYLGEACACYILLQVSPAASKDNERT
jgi:hypothetical protein